MNLIQQTIKNSLSIAGVGLHTGKNVQVTFLPAPVLMRTLTQAIFSGLVTITIKSASTFIMFSQTAPEQRVF